MPQREIAEEIGRFREKLLELSNRNPLLNYRKTKLKTLEFEEESPDRVYRRLVDDGKQFRFAPRPEAELFAGSSENGEAVIHAEGATSPIQLESDSLYLGEDWGTDVSVSERQNDGLLQTTHTAERLETVLKHIRREANTAIEETGVNFLYIALGMLAWRDDVNSERELLAPLLLIPVQIDRDFDSRSQRYRYAAKWREEEVQDNLSLLKKLEKDFGMRLPRFEQELTPEQYFAQVEEAVCSGKAWTVQRDALLGFFSFQKLLMYLDIDPNKWSKSGMLEEGSIVHQLVWGSEANAGAPLYASDYEIDNHPTANEVIFPLDADSSQHSALVDIQAGKSLVIEGPPGTGKSQTITNAIAAALHQGKNVLFVAEKLTALEVVREKLDRLGLGDFCLELHSDAASPRMVYESLRKRLEHSYTEPTRLNVLRSELKLKQQHLANYLKSTSQIVGPYEEPLYDLMWRVANLRSSGFTYLRRTAFDPNINQAILHENSELLDAFAQSLGELPNPKESPWWGCWSNSLNPNDIEWVDEAIVSLIECANQAEDAVANFAERFGHRALSWLRRHVQQNSNRPDLSSLLGASSGLKRDCDLRPLLITHNRKLASQFEHQVKSWWELREQVSHILPCDLKQASATSRALCGTFDAPVLNMLSESTVGDLKTCTRVLLSLDEMLKDSGGEAAQEASREILCQQIIDSLGGVPLQAVVAAYSCGVDYQAAVAALDAQTVDGVASWFFSLPDGRSKIATCRELKTNRPEAVTPCNVRHFSNVETRSLILTFLQTAEEYRQLKVQVAQKSFISADATLPSAAKACETLQDRLAAIPTTTTWQETKQLRVRLRTLEDVLASWKQVAAIARNQGLGPCRSLRELDEALYVCQLMRHSVVANLDALPPSLFFQAAGPKLARGRQRCRELCDQANNLAVAFDMGEVPDAAELTALLKTLRIYSDSFFRFFSREYREVRRAIAGFSRGVVPKSNSVIVNRLERLRDWMQLRDAFHEDEELSRILGENFAGIETDWERCDTLFKWTVVAKSKGLDHAKACDLLGRRDADELSLKELSECAKGLRSELSDALTLGVLGFAEATVDDVQLELLHQRAAFLRGAAEEMEASLSDFAIGDHETLADVEQLCLAAVRLHTLEEAIVDSQRWEGLGDFYRSLDTPTDELQSVSGWCESLINLGLPQVATDWVLEGDTTQKLETLATGAERFCSIADKWRAQLNHAAILRAWIEDVGFPIAEALEQADVLPLSDGDTVREVISRCELIVEAYEAEQSIRDHSKWNALGDVYQGVSTQAADVAAAVEWATTLAGMDLPEDMTSVLATSQQLLNCQQLIEWTSAVEQAAEGWQRVRERFQQVGEVSREWMPWSFPEPNSDLLSKSAQQLQERINELPAWVAFCRMRELCLAAGLTDFVSAVIERRVPPDRISGVYRLTVLESIAEQKIADSGLLRTFSRAAIEKARRKYQELDKEVLVVNRSLVAYHAAKHSAPLGNSIGRVGEYTELGLIRHEIQKQRRHCRIRDLLTRAGAAVQALKPCFMMSPLSVSQYLEPEGMQFDLVVMDEASQIKPEDAIGVLLRAKQIVVVGDPKQLPPSSYFDRISSEVTDDEATQFDNTESVLEVAMKAFQPVRRLRWHYRSLHESLIHFSNDRFYDGDLVVFPSPSTDEGTLGLRFHYIEDAAFDKGANTVEAERVARAIIEHAKANPKESLAVASFNAKQSGLIQDYLESLCMKDEEARSAVEALNENERLLIKNLENLQGDERDVVFISYTYGPDPASGTVMNRFGPITGEEGWRRLNVLVSRARRRVEVFASMQPAQIKLGPGKSRGVTAFRDYLEYVQTGFLPERAIITDRPMDSPFEEAVGKVVTRLGYEVVPQVGVAGYFIDLGVRLPGQQDFILGIECDGATYHSSKSARDRDRLREEVIRSRGWQLHRIWSTDWFLNQKHEEERLAKRIAAIVT